MRSLHRVYEVVGVPVPPWRSIERRPQPVTAVLRDYGAHLRQHRGNPEITIRKKLDQVGKLLEHLKRSDKSCRQLSLPDIDAFLIGCARRYARSTTADIASTVRSFARFLLVSGRIRADLADAVISPVQPRFERPPTCLALGRRSAIAARPRTTVDDEHLWPQRRRSDRLATAAH
ncbi:site-specific integrase [Caballeronia sordidicola]|uniref:site-specific integrase n=1 Tax=Caballeronia sordidicola TaxID=196367 RepID=UPI000AA432D0